MKIQQKVLSFCLYWPKMTLNFDRGRQGEYFLSLWGGIFWGVEGGGNFFWKKAKNVFSPKLIQMWSQIPRKWFWKMFLHKSCHLDCFSDRWVWNVGKATKQMLEKRFKIAGWYHFWIFQNQKNITNETFCSKNILKPFSCSLRNLHHI